MSDTSGPTGKITKSKQEWERQLSTQEYRVTREAATDHPFAGPYVDNHESGEYRCVCCGELLFSSEAKFDSGTGWPSFTEPANLENVELREDDSHGMRRTEVVCRHCDAHLGHLFDDGPGPTGARYCMNGSALDFRAEDG